MEIHCLTKSDIPGNCVFPKQLTEARHVQPAFPRPVLPLGLPCHFNRLPFRSLIQCSRKQRYPASSHAILLGCMSEHIRSCWPCEPSTAVLGLFQGQNFSGLGETERIKVEQNTAKRKSCSISWHLGRRGKRHIPNLHLGQ